MAYKPMSDKRWKELKKKIEAKKKKKHRSLGERAWQKLWDAQGGKCYLCGLKMNTVAGHPKQASVDHVVAKSTIDFYKAEKKTNKKLAHRECNTRKGSLPLDQFFAIIEETDLVKKSEG